MEQNKFDIGIIGGGPAGYAAAIRASQKGLKVVLFEKDCVGGVCLNRGCIPTKVILHCTEFFKSLKKADKFGICIENASIDYKKIFERKNNICSKIQNSLRKLILSHDVKIVDFEAKILSENLISADDIGYECKNIIIATGARPSEIKGLGTDGDFIVNSDQLLNMSELPENILIIGSGAIGIEWARIFSALNKSVTIVEMAKNLLPVADEDVSARIERLFKKDKVKFFKETCVERIENKTVILSNGTLIEPDMVLVAAGRAAILPEVENIDIVLNKKFIAVNNNFKTNIENIFAVGDVNGTIQLAHAATHQALAVVDYIVENELSTDCHAELVSASDQKTKRSLYVGQTLKQVQGDNQFFDGTSDPSTRYSTSSEVCLNSGISIENIPSVIYGNPEIAWVGKREADFENGNYQKSIFPIAALGKAQADDEIDGFIKVLSQNKKIIGAHIVAPEASALIQQFALMIDNEIKIEDILKTTFAHPTYSEGVFESILALDDLSLSIPHSQRTP